MNKYIQLTINEDKLNKNKSCNENNNFKEKNV